MRAASSGMTLVELLVAMAIAAITGAMILQLVIVFQGHILKEVSRNDLQDRAERLVRFMAKDLAGSAFMLSSVPRLADGSSLSLVHDSFPGDPQVLLPFSILANDVPNADDTLTFIKAESFSPPLRISQDAVAGEDALTLNRQPNRSPGSTRELLPAPEAINHLVIGKHHRCYAVLQADQTLSLAQPLAEDVHAGNEVLGVRAYDYRLDPAGDSNRLRRDDFTSRNILDDAIDGLQFKYLLKDGSMTSQPNDPRDIRAVKLDILVRDLRMDRSYRNNKLYVLGNRTYGPFQDHYRRYLATRLVEVKNHGLE